MPCQSYETPYYVDPTQKQIADKLARLLCATLKQLEQTDEHVAERVFGAVPGLEKWWTEHQKADAEEAARKAKIIAEGKARKAALAEARDQLLVLTIWYYGLPYYVAAWMTIY